VKSWQGQGAYGAVYRAVRRGFRRTGPVALKVSLLPWDARFAREAEVLSRLSHPSIPRLLDRGEMRPASGADYPFIVMEWVEGPPLYAWAEQQARSTGEVCRVLSQLARALEAVHGAGAVHRDVKGDNVLVRLSDRRGVLTDFGSCHLEGAARLTWKSLPPVTPAYLSPQAGLFHVRSLHHPDSYYPPSPADDLYALGVTAYRLVMGQYPPPLDARQDEQGAWRVTSPDVRPLLESNSRVEPRLREVISRLLSDAPEARARRSRWPRRWKLWREGMSALSGPSRWSVHRPGSSGSPWRQREPARCCCGILKRCPTRLDRSPRVRSRLQARQTRVQLLSETPLPRSRLRPPSHRQRRSPLPRSPFPSPVQGRPGQTRGASVRVASRWPSTEAAGWSCCR